MAAVSRHSSPNGFANIMASGLRALDDLEGLVRPGLHVAELALGLALDALEPLAPQVLDHAPVLLGRLGVRDARALLDHADHRAVERVERLPMAVQDLDGQLEPALVDPAVP